MNGMQEWERMNSGENECRRAPDIEFGPSHEVYPASNKSPLEIVQILDLFTYTQSRCADLSKFINGTFYHSLLASKYSKKAPAVTAGKRHVLYKSRAAIVETCLAAGTD